MATRDPWQVELARFRPAWPSLVAQRDLLRRADWKFLMPRASAVELLPALVNDYAVLAAGSGFIASYRTLYYDTPALDFFHAQRRGRRVRHKVRVRHYPDRLLSFLEIKQRRSELQSSKIRIQRRYDDDDLTAADQAIVDIHTGIGRPVEPQAWTRFRRVTLLGLHTDERVTIDTGLVVQMGTHRRSFAALAIVEVKQWPIHHHTIALSAIRAGGWRPGWMSKYCTAIAGTHPDARLNGLLPGLRALKRGVA